MTSRATTSRSTSADRRQSASKGRPPGTPVALYHAFRLAAALARAAPLRLSYAVGGACGAAAYYAWPGGRRRCIANMRHVVGSEAHARRMARRSFANYGIYLVDFLRSTSVTAEEVRTRVVFGG